MVFVELRERIEMAARRAGFDSQVELAEACGVRQPSIHALISGKYPMKDLLRKVAQVTGVSHDWLRDGTAADAPGWARDPILVAMDDAQTAVNGMHALKKHNEELKARIAQLERELAEAKTVIADMRIEQRYGVGRPAANLAASPEKKYSDQQVVGGFDRE